MKPYTYQVIRASMLLGRVHSYPLAERPTLAEAAARAKALVSAPDTDPDHRAVQVSRLGAMAYAKQYQLQSPLGTFPMAAVYFIRRSDGALMGGPRRATSCR